MRLVRAEAEGRRGVRAILEDVAIERPVVLGVSGGADSLALAACARFVAAEQGRGLEAVVVDHGLQDGSGEVADVAVRTLGRLDVPARTVRVDVGGTGGPEAAARRARREALLAAAGDGVVLLGHTLDDQAETVLLGLGRGSGQRSVAGMRAVDGPWRRPLLRLRRADTEAVCREHGVTWWDDPHNTDPRYRRSRVRHEALPLLEDVLGGGVAEALARTAEQAGRDADALDAAAADVPDPSDVETLAALHPGVRSRVLRRLALDAGALPGELNAAHLAELDRLVTHWHGQGGVELPGHVVVRRVGTLLTSAPPAVAG